MKKVLVPLAPGFEEIETITIVNILRRSGARVTISGISVGPIEGSRGITLIPDENIDDIKSDDFDLIVVPGGNLGTKNLIKNQGITDILKKMNDNGKLIGAICAAPIVLEANGLLNNRKRTSHPSVKEKLSGKFFSEERVVVDGNIITSQAPGTAIEFSLKLVEILFGKDRVGIVNKGILAKI